MTSTITRAGATESARRLRRLDEDLAVLERAEALLREARALREIDPRAAFETAHRAALRGAGVVIERENRSRKRRLPMNAWEALSRCGVVHRQWAVEVKPLVAERDRLARANDLRPDPGLLAAHLELTGARIAAVRAEILVELLPGSVPDGAQLP